MTTSSLSIAAYQPFEFTKYLYSNVKDLCRESSPSYLKTAIKVGLIALHVLLMLPALILDAIFIGAKLLCGRCAKREIPYTPPPDPVRIRTEPFDTQAEEPPEEAPFRQIAKRVPPTVPNAEEIQRALANPFRETFPVLNDAGEVDPDRYLTEAVDGACQYLTPEKAAYYRELLRFGGMKEDGDPGEIEVYLWIAECTILRYLLAFQFECPAYLKNYRDHSVDGRESLEELSLTIDALLPDQKAALILQVYNPQIKWALDQNTKRIFEYQIWGLAEHLSRNPEFLQSVRRRYPVQ